LFKDQDSLLSPSVETEIFLGDGRLETAESIGNGFQYFWLDNENFVIVQGLPNPHLLKVNVESKFPEPLVDDSDLAFLLPEVAEVDLEISNAATDPTEPDLIFITAANRLENIDYVFTYNWRSGEKKLLFTIEDSPGGLQSPRFSPDHRWLVLQTLFGMSVSSNRRISDLYLYDLETGENLLYSLTAEIAVGGSGWTNNGQWLAFRGQGFLLLSNPAANYDHLVLHEFGDCTDAAWIQK
jgi:dipeptidyl aminopeptidase/acylaminoacyl peptidase